MLKGKTLVAAALFALAASLITSTSLVRADSPDYSIASNPPGNCVHLGDTASYRISLSSLGGFAGTIALDAHIDQNTANGPTVSSLPVNVTLTAGQTVAFDLFAYTTQNTPSQVYTITIDGYSWADSNVHWETVYLAFQPLCGSDNGFVTPIFNVGQLAAPAGIALVLVGVTAATALFYNSRRKPVA